MTSIIISICPVRRTLLNKPKSTNCRFTFSSVVPLVAEPAEPMGENMLSPWKLVSYNGVLMCLPLLQYVAWGFINLRSLVQMFCCFMLLLHQHQLSHSSPKDVGDESMQQQRSFQHLPAGPMTGNTSGLLGRAGLVIKHSNGKLENCPLALDVPIKIIKTSILVRGFPNHGGLVLGTHPTGWVQAVITNKPGSITNIFYHNNNQSTIINFNDNLHITSDIHILNASKCMLKNLHSKCWAPLRALMNPVISGARPQ